MKLKARVIINQFPVPSFALTDALSQAIKAFQNPVWVEQARQRLNQIKVLTTVIT